ncbi:MAG: DUF983 domain-containing protein [Rhizobiaceae bacterium]
MPDHQHYPPLDPVPTGMKGRCPRCGEGNLFTGLLTVKDRCSACHLDYDFNDSGDGPTVFIIMGLGFLVLGMALFVELNYAPPGWVHVLLWPPMILIIGLPALRMLKGVLINLTWHHDAASGRLDKPQD